MDLVSKIEHLQKMAELCLRRRPQVSCGADWICDFTVLDLFLAFDTVGCPGHSFQASLAYRGAALQALSIAPLTDSLKSEPDQRQLRMAGRPLSEQQLLLIGGHGLVGDILRGLGCNFPALFHRGQHGALQQCLLLTQLFSKAPYIV